MAKFNTGVERKVSEAGEEVSKLAEKMGNQDKDKSET